MDSDEPMSRSLRTPRAAAIAGVLFALLLAATLALIRLATPSDAGEVGAWLNDPSRKRMIVLALNLVPFAGIAFVWFIGVVRDRIGQREDRFFATVFLGTPLRPLPGARWVEALPARSRPSASQAPPSFGPFGRVLPDAGAGEPAGRQGGGSVGQYLARSSGVSVSCGFGWKPMMLWITFGYCTAGATPTFQ